MKYRLPLALFAMLAACGDKEEPPPAAPAVEIAVADQYGAFDAEVTGIAFWTHPTLPFRGLLIAASENGLVAFNIEDGAEAARADDIKATGIAVSYTGAGEKAQGYAAVSTGAGADGGISFYAIDNASRSLISTPAFFVPGMAEDRGFCLGRDESGEALLVHRARRSGLASHLVASGEETADAKERFTPFRGGFTACVADDVDRAIFAATEKGDIYRIDRSGAIGEAPLVKSHVENPLSLGLTYSGLVEGGPTEECCGYLYLFDGARVHVFDREDGRALGIVTLGASFENDGVAAASVMGVGAGNFGGLYRDGVLALATAGTAPVIRLAPVTALADALALKFGVPANLRGLGAQTEEAPGLDIGIRAPDAP